MMYYDELAAAQEYVEEIQDVIKKLTGKPAKEIQKRGRKPQVVAPKTSPQVEKLTTKAAKPKAVEKKVANAKSMSTPKG
ncbi:MAG: hypothetical protein NT040_00815 [Bacteroidetes bacterium]|nr:hypothetical protein [Bacteroidota bacterium]